MEGLVLNKEGWRISAINISFSPNNFKGQSLMKGPLIVHGQQLGNAETGKFSQRNTSHSSPSYELEPWTKSEPVVVSLSTR